MTPITENQLILEKLDALTHMVDNLSGRVSALDTKLMFLQQDIDTIKEDTHVIEETLVDGIKGIIKIIPQPEQKNTWVKEQL
jgi:predicted  nucleic acid-binding Zn-ribbon protein